MIRDIVRKFTSDETKVFIFGSSLKKEQFYDIDVGIKGGGIKASNLVEIRDLLEESTIPYKVDFVDFSGVDKNFEKTLFRRTAWNYL